MADSNDRPLLYTLLGLNRAGKFLYVALMAAAVAGTALWTVARPHLRFSDEDERLFRAARHGDIAGIEHSLNVGGGANDAAPVDGQTALFRAAVFGHADAVRILLSKGADPERRDNDGRTALEVVLAARSDEKNPALAEALDRVATVLREVER